MNISNSSGEGPRGPLDDVPNGDGASLVETEPRRRVRPRWREFVVTALDDQLDRHAGPGMTLDHAIAQEARNHADGRDIDTETPAEYATIIEDVVIWEGIRVAAV